MTNMDEIRKATEKFTQGLTGLIREAVYEQAMLALATTGVAKVTAALKSMTMAGKEGAKEIRAEGKRLRRLAPKKAAKRGVYTVTDAGSASTPYVLTRGEQKRKQDGVKFRIGIVSAGKVKPAKKSKPVKAPTPATTLDQDTILRAMALMGWQVGAAQLATYTTMPNGNVGRALKQLREAGRVKMFGEKRGATYGLVSTGSVKPVKRKPSAALASFVESALAAEALEADASSFVRREAYVPTPAITLAPIRDDWGYEPDDAQHCTVSPGEAAE